MRSFNGYCQAQFAKNVLYEACAGFACDSALPPSAMRAREAPGHLQSMRGERENKEPRCGKFHVQLGGSQDACNACMGARVKAKSTRRGWQVSILLMVAGAVIAGLTDLTYSLPGYLWVSVCAVSTAVYLLLIRLLKDRTGALPHALAGAQRCLSVLPNTAT